MKLSKKQTREFQKTIYDYYKIFGRPFSWRQTTNPYHIFVSEVMLQQTQTTRVKQKYEAFIAKFPDFHTLAHASTFDLLGAWQGLGYNRRALWLQKSAQIICKKYKNALPQEPEELVNLPGIGPATAASIQAFAFNQATVFVETNVRIVFFHFFFQEQDSVSDKEILELVAQTLDRKNPRTWYYALMDYGVMLKAQGFNPLKKSKHYHKQSKFAGSDREIRGAILKLLLKNNVAPTRVKLTIDEITQALSKNLQATQERVNKIITQLVDEKFITQNKTKNLVFIENFDIFV